MKIRKVLFVFFLMSISLPMFSQRGYWYNSHFVEITPKYNNRFYVQSLDNTELSKTHFFQKIKSVLSVLDKGIIVESDVRPTEDFLYTSDIYQNENCESFIILPKIIISTCEISEANKTIKKYENYLTLYKQEKNLFRYDCKLLSADAILDLAKELQHDNSIEWCEPIMAFSIIRHNNNEFYSEQYYLKNNGQIGGALGIDINAESAWDLITGNPDITIAVIDDGVDPNHEDMDGIVLSGLTTSNSLAHGEPQNINEHDPKGHGTCCAGIIAAVDNSLGIKGVASGVKILPINICPNYSTPNEDGFETNSENIADAIIWASQRADVISCSWGGSPENSFVSNAIRDARVYGRNGKGSIVVFASGNSSDSPIRFPANVEGVVTVGAIDSIGQRWDYSQYGDSLNVVAPSGDTNLFGDIVTTDRMGVLGFDTLSNYTHHFGGTSAACPQVAGVFGLILSANPLLTETAAKQVLYNTCRNLPEYNTGWDYEVGYGLVDAGAAVESCILKIVGPDIPCGMSYYKVTHLPIGYSVAWSWKNGSSIDIYTPNADSCLIINYNKLYINDVLVASISKNGIVETTLEKEINTGANFYGYYWENPPSSIPEVHTFKSGQTILVSRGKSITLMSSDFSGASISLSGVLPTFWSHNGNQITLYYVNSQSLKQNETEGIPGLFLPTTTITGVPQMSYQTYRFDVLPTNGLSLLNSYDLSIIGSNNSYTFSLVPVEANTDSTFSDEQPIKWTLSVVNCFTGKCVYVRDINKEYQMIDTSNWEKGIYVVLAKIGDTVITKKICIKIP